MPNVAEASKPVEERQEVAETKPLQLVKSVSICWSRKCRDSRVINETCHR
jgi:hypothetical protein